MLFKAKCKNQGTIRSQQAGDTIAMKIERMPSALTVAELTALLGVGKSFLYGMTKRGRIPHIRMGSIVRFDPSETAAWLRQRMTGTSSLAVA